MFARGVELMILGMSVVFLFLGVLILAIRAISYPFRRRPDTGTEGRSTAAETSGLPKDGGDVLAAIVASVTDYGRERF